ncbi:MAG: hypothetical protein RIB84_23975 [Sneathiellaceae bacterium]
MKDSLEFGIYGARETGRVTVQDARGGDLMNLERVKIAVGLGDQELAFEVDPHVAVAIGRAILLVAERQDRLHRLNWETPARED